MGIKLAEVDISSEKYKLSDNKVIPKNKDALFMEIFINNASVCTKMIVGGFTFGIWSIIELFKNGLSFGIIMMLGIKKYGLFNCLNVTLPHCIEVVPLILSTYIGVLIGLKMINSLFYNSRKQNKSIKYIYILTSVVFFLLLISSFLETYVSIQ